MKRNICMGAAVVLGLVFVFSAIAFAGGNQTPVDAIVAEYPVLVNGEQIKMSLPMYSIGNRTYMPLRELCDVLKIDISWNETTQSVEITNDTKDSDGKIEKGFDGKDGWTVESYAQVEISKETAISLADDVYLSLYGKDYIDNTLIGVADEGEYYWVFRYKEGELGGTVEICIRKCDGRIMKISLAE